MNSPRHALSALLLCGSILLIPNAPARAGSATWNLNPTNGSWNTAANWTPATVPNGPDDTAAFGVSTITQLSVADSITLNSVIFDSTANPYTFTLDLVNVSRLSLLGDGIINNSGRVQNFINSAFLDAPGSVIQFMGTASAGNRTVFTNQGGAADFAGASISFYDQSNAGTAMFFNQATTVFSQKGAKIEFSGEASAGNATIINEGAAIIVRRGGIVKFWDHATAANAAFEVHGGTAPGAHGSEVYFHDNSTAGSATFVVGPARDQADGGSVRFDGFSSAENATFTVTGSSTSLYEGAVSFSDHSDAANGTFVINSDQDGVIIYGLGFGEDSTGGTSQVEAFGLGYVTIGGHNPPGVTIGSLAGDGHIVLGDNNLSIGSNNLTTKFSGHIEDGGSVTKIGTGTLTLSGGTSSYSGGTTIEGGKLIVNNTSGSATGTGPVQVNAGQLGGGGIIAGAVTVGTRSGPGAILAPGKGRQNNLIIQSALTFNSDGAYQCRVNSGSISADAVIAKGVTINSARFILRDQGGLVLPPETVVTVLANISVNPIIGTFANLADGSTLTVGSNTYQASYEGNDGNDLTLTVQ